MKMKKKYMTPDMTIFPVEMEPFCAVSTEKASIGAAGEANEINQDNIVGGGPGVSGAKKVGTWDTWDE